jgi:hypothetical protein
VDINKSIKWLSESTKIDRSGYLYFGLKMPRFREVRAEIDNARNVGDF